MPTHFFAISFCTFVETCCMPEIIVRYKDQRTLDALRDFAKYFDYEISLPDSADTNEKLIPLNGVTVVAADRSIDTSALAEIFTGKHINPAQLRKDAWQR